MNLLILPGNSIKNKAWAETVEDSVKELFDSTVVQNYDHWKAGKENIFFGQELEKLAKTVEFWAEYVILAKSVGVRLALETVNSGKAKPQRTIFIGTAWLPKLEKPEIPVLFIQHTSDPLLNAAELKAHLEKSGYTNYRFEELPGNTHDYAEIDKIKQIIQDYL